MSKIITEAWVLYPSKNPSKPEPGQLVRETIAFPSINEEEVLIEPLFGCWEANMAHAIQRAPVDVAAQRKEEKIVLGNSGVVRLLQVGSKVKGFKEGDICLLFPGPWDKHGYMPLAFAYDAPHTIGMLAKQTKVHFTQIAQLPENSKYSFRQWAAFSLRYMTAWSNWNIALGAYRLQMSVEDNPSPFVWGWGGGSTLAELALAKLHGCSPVMISSKKCHLEMIDRMGIMPLDFNFFPDLNYDEAKYREDAEYRKKYLASEETFLNYVREFTEGEGVSIFVDFIGSPVVRASMRALSRQGVITTAGWKKGMKTTSVRAVECIQRHIHIHTHYARLSDGRPAIEFAEKNAWIPWVEEKTTSWDDIPTLVSDYEQGRVNTYFPLYSINPL